MGLEKLRVVDPVLTSVVRGYSNNAYIAQAHFPFVPVDKEGFKVAQFGKDSFKLTQTERAIHAKSNRGQASAPTAIDVVLTEHDYELPVDTREIGDAIFDVERQRAITCMDIVLLGMEKQAADILQDPNNYGVNNKVTLTSTDQFTNQNSDPFKTIDMAIDAVRSQIGKKPNVMTLGASAFAALKNHPKVIERVKYTMKGVITLDLFKSLFDGFEDIRVGEAVYADDAGNIHDVWGDNVVLSYRAPAMEGIDRSMYEPSFAYAFRRKGYPYSDTYVENGGKVRIVRATDLYALKILGAEAAFLIKDTNG